MRFTETARDHLNIERTWWLKNRDHQALLLTNLNVRFKFLPYYRALVRNTRILELGRKPRTWSG